MTLHHVDPKNTRRLAGASPRGGGLHGELEARAKQSLARSNAPTSSKPGVGSRELRPIERVTAVDRVVVPTKRAVRSVTSARASIETNR
jgi:hypothetical protein